MRTFWTGSISFGLVNVPVRLFAATRDHVIHFHQLHRKDHGRVHYQLVCEVCGAILDRGEDTVRGYEIGLSEYVIFDEPELEALASPESRTIDILDFVDLKQVDPVYFEKAYYLSPQKGAAKAYHLLREAMDQTGRLAIATVTLRSRSNLSLLRSASQVLMMETMRFADEINSLAELPIEPAALCQRELDLAESLVGSLSGPFEPERYQDSFRASLKAAIDRKVEGKAISIPHAKERTEFANLLEALEASLRKIPGPEFKAAMPEQGTEGPKG